MGPNKYSSCPRKRQGYRCPKGQDDLKNAGAKWSDEVSVRDRNWVSSRQPDDIPEFNRNMLELFAEEKQKGRRAA